ncbi:hypothetical protein EMCG_06509 [[Emmonsia] crescens]|uniref:Uncharacterized protein n=1 Tax=[Emmonsia] crescens TaxID=73230 RepID=A0A0G2IAW0_9EURO|nr:hypothetical protein EMCG_06509 [Emmonsia crescens UAMH 3008]
MGCSVFNFSSGNGWPWCWSSSTVIASKAVRQLAIPPKEPGIGQAQDLPYIHVAAMSPEWHVSEFKSQPKLLQFTGEEIEEIDNYHGLKLSHEGLPSVLFSAKTKNGIEWLTSAFDFGCVLSSPKPVLAVGRNRGRLDTFSVFKSLPLMAFLLKSMKMRHLQQATQLKLRITSTREKFVPRDYYQVQLRSVIPD